MPEVLTNPQLDSSLQHFSYLDGILATPRVGDMTSYQRVLPLI